MTRLKKLFGGLDMTWTKVIIFAVVTAVYTALINQVPFLKGTSFQDIAVNLECWILFALIVITNCKKWWEASLKCFVFFLISQPLIYLVEVPFIGWSVFGYYKYWGIITVLTLPGAAIAFLVKNKNWLSVAVLSVANCFLGYSAVTYFRTSTTDFPRQFAASLFCIALIVIFTLVFFDDAKHRTVAFILAGAVILGAFIFTGRNVSNEIELGDGNWTYTIEDNSVVDIKIDGSHAKIKSKKAGGTSIIFKSSDGTETEYYATVSGGGVYLSRFDD